MDNWAGVEITNGSPNTRLSYSSHYFNIIVVASWEYWTPQHRRRYTQLYPLLPVTGNQHWRAAPCLRISTPNPSPRRWSCAKWLSRAFGLPSCYFFYPSSVLPCWFLYHTSLEEDIDLALFEGIKVREYLVKGGRKEETSQLEPKTVINNCFVWVQKWFFDTSWYYETWQ